MTKEEIAERIRHTYEIRGGQLDGAEIDVADPEKLAELLAEMMEKINKE